jgi:hypothetical protein
VSYLFSGSIILLKGYFLNSFLANYTVYLGISATIMMSLCLLLLSINSIPIILVYMIFIVYNTIYEFVLVFGYSEIAKNLKISRFSGIFSMNLFLHNMFQLLIQFIIGKQFLSLTPRYLLFFIVIY